MSVFRSYFSKNDTIIKDNLSNNSQNPVTEISYGTFEKQVSRFIFDVDLTNLTNRIINGAINPNRIVKHVLHMTNTISYAPQYIGKKSYSLGIDRASSFELEVFNVDEDWDEGSGYDFEYKIYPEPYVDIIQPNLQIQAVNWFDRKTELPWLSGGSYISGVTEIVGAERFETGAENIEIDITDYVNQRLFGTGFTGTSAYTGASFGLGIKFAEIYEEIETEYRQAVAFHAKNTNTWYEPYIETIIDDEIKDDRNYFYLDKDNDLYLYVNIGGLQQNINVNTVTIHDHEDNVIDVLSGESIINVSEGVYKVTLNIDSELYPDAVLFRDVWSIDINGKESEHAEEFYLVKSNNYYSLNNSNDIEFDNYFFYFWGISEKEKLRASGLRKVKLTIKELYPNQNNFIPLDIEYRLFTTVGEKYEIDVVPFTSVNRTNAGYEFNIDTSWLIPQDYFLQIRLKNGIYYENKQTIGFTIVSDGILNV